MKEKVNSISLGYGDTLLHLYQFHLSSKGSLEKSVFHEHKFYEIHIAKNGSYTYTLNDRSITLNKNQILIIPPDVSHASVYNTSWDYEFAVLSLALERREGESGFYSFFSEALNSCSLLPISVPATLVHRVGELKNNEYYGAIKGECYLKMQGGAIVYELFESLNHFKSEEALRSTTTESDNRLILLDVLVHEPSRSLTDIAAAINYSSRHTSRLIRSIYGCSLSELRRKNGDDSNA